MYCGCACSLFCRIVEFRLTNFRANRVNSESVSETSSSQGLQVHTLKPWKPGARKAGNGQRFQDAGRGLVYCFRPEEATARFATRIWVPVETFHLSVCKPACRRQVQTLKPFTSGL